MRVCLLALWAGSLVASALAGEQHDPARFLSGNIPGQPPLASTGGFVALEVEIAPSGIVTDVVVLDDAPPFTEVVEKEVRLWRFHPARENGAAVFGKAIVIGLFRPPILMGSGDPPPAVNVRPPSEELPYPTQILTPNYPPTALYEGVALVEATIDDEGNVSETTLRTNAEAYGELALDACQQFRFRPARLNGHAAVSYALVLFGFRQPVTPQKRPRRNH